MAPRKKGLGASRSGHGRGKTPGRSGDGATVRPGPWPSLQTAGDGPGDSPGSGGPDVDTPMLPFPVAGVGASAGGLEAFIELLRSLPPDSGMAYVFVQHLDPTHSSALPELLGAASPIPVREVFNGVRLEADHVYVIPPNTSMTVVDGHLRLTPRQPGRGVPMPINDFFRSLAERQGPRAIGVVLSGAATDGTAGLEAIKGAGGITFAQDETTAKFTGMPRSAIATGCVDFVLRPAEIAKELVRISRHHYVTTAGGEAASTATRDEGGDVLRILAALRRTCDVDFSQYKMATLRRRIHRRMLLQRLDQLADYAATVQRDAVEAEALCQDLLIRVTSFFRDPEVFETLNHSVFPELVRGRPPDAPIRLWVPGCSSGEEAYSLAICLTEYLDNVQDPPTIQLYGTDINDVAILRARAGVYLDSITAEVSPDRLRRFFTKEEGGGYRISSAIRDLCVFAKQDLTRDPPFSQIDLISCRNVLIYLTQPLQKRVFTLFHYALRPTGVLLLGGAESVGAFPELFAPADKKHRLYRKTSAPPGLLQFDMLTGRRRPAHASQAKPGHMELATLRDLQRESDRIVLSALAPVGAVVNEGLEVVQFRGRTAPYLEPPQGAASHHVLKMVRREFLGPLRAALEEARQTAEPVEKPDIKTTVEGEAVVVTLRVVPFRAVPSGQRFFVVLFERQSRAHRSRRPLRAVAPAPPERSTRSRRARELEQELAATREYMQAIVQEQEATNEELRSSTEEIQSSYEELQSSNEELETAKEELQSANEELTTVNEELQRRTFDLSEANDDLTNFLASVNIPLIRVGNDLRIRRFTPNADRVLNVITTDIGRSIGDITLKVVIPDFEQRIAHVMDSLAVTELEAQDTEGHWWSVRIRPYRTSDHKIDGVVIAFVDIDSLNEMGRAARLGRVRVERIHDIIQALARDVSEAQVAAVLAGQARDAVSADGALLAMRRPGGPWEPVFHAGYPPDRLEALLQLANRGVAPMGWAAAAHEIVALSSPEDIATRFPEAANLLAGLGARAYLALPVDTGSERIGALGLFFREERLLDDQTVHFMSAIAQLGGLAFERAQQTTRQRLVREQEGVLRRERDAALEVANELIALINREFQTPRGVLATGDGPTHSMDARRTITLVNELGKTFGTPSVAASGGPVRLSTLVQDALSAIRPLAASKGLRLQEEAGTGTGDAQVNGDWVRRTLVSLLAGLVQLLPGGTLSVSAQVVDGAATIRVHADGEPATGQRLKRLATLLSGDARATGGDDGSSEPGVRLAFAMMRQAAARATADVAAAPDGHRRTDVRIRVPLQRETDQRAPVS